MAFKKGKQLAICEHCGKEFTMMSPQQKHCSRKCFRTAFYRKNNPKEYPEFICSNCGASTRLNFNVIQSYVKWEDFKCPKCGVPNQRTIGSEELFKDLLGDLDVFWH